MEKIACSLVFLAQADWVYLAIGKKGRSKGFFNGYGGKQEAGETVVESAIRELSEPEEAGGIGVDAGDLRKVCVIVFHSNGEIEGISRPDARTLELHVYVTSRWEGEPIESEAFNAPLRFNKSTLPIELMLPDNKFWFERALSHDIPFTGDIWYATLEGRSITTKVAIHDKPDQNLLDIP